jgi:hypothetical protein
MMPPHLALLNAFADLNDVPREAINRLTGRHLDFFYRRVLRFEPRPAVSDRAHVLIELKKGAAPVALGPQHAFSAGKDAAGVELVYAPTGETVVNASRIESLCSLYLDPADRGTVRFAPVADSADGLGGPLPAAEPRWRAFGHPGLPAAEAGFAVAAPVLRMKEGRRKVTLALRLGDLDAEHAPEALAASFQAFLTGEKSWLGPYDLSASLSGGFLRLSLEVPESHAAVVDHDPAVHGSTYAAEGPVLRLTLQPASPLGYAGLAGLTVRAASVEVEVTGVTSLALESDAGTLDSKKAFLPFGPQPAVGSRFLVSSAEAFTKNISKIELHLQWQGAPSNFHAWYAGYKRAAKVNNGWFTAEVSWRDAAGWKPDEVRALFDPRTPAGETILTLTPGSVPAPPAAKPGFLALSLKQDFLHADYRQESVANLVTFSRDGGTLVTLNEPYTPTLRSVSLSYQARSGDGVRCCRNSRTRGSCSSASPASRPATA